MRESKKLRLLCLAALFAGAIAVTTAYLLHIPIPTGGYIHLGDALIYLAACLLPAPYAVGAAMVGAGLADLLTAPLWVVPTLLIKALVALLFTSRGPRLLCPRNGAALLLACLLSPAAYGLAACLPAAGRRQRLLAPVPGHAGTGGGQRGGLYCLGAGPGPGRR